MLIESTKKLLFTVLMLIASLGDALGYEITIVQSPGFSYSALSGINNHGEMVGYGHNIWNGDYTGFYYSSGTFDYYEKLGSLESLLIDINNHGDVVGIANNSDTLGLINYQESFVQKANGEVQVLPQYADKKIRAQGITDSGVVYGFMFDPQYPPLSGTGFFYKDNGYQLFNIDGAAATIVSDYRKDLNMFIGQAYDEKEVSRSYVSRSGNIIFVDDIFLSVLFDEDFIIGSEGDSLGLYTGYLTEGVFTQFDFNMSDALWTYVTDINDYGDMVGYYVNSDYSYAGFIARAEEGDPTWRSRAVPEPSSELLFYLGLLIIGVLSSFSKPRINVWSNINYRQ